jgi:hypothetical protein
MGCHQVYVVEELVAYVRAETCTSGRISSFATLLIRKTTGDKSSAMGIIDRH